MEFFEQEFIESCFEDLFEEEAVFAGELECYLESLTQDEVGRIMNQLDAVTLVDSETVVSSDERTVEEVWVDSVLLFLDDWPCK